MGKTWKRREERDGVEVRERGRGIKGVKMRSGIWDFVFKTWGGLAAFGNKTHRSVLSFFEFGDLFFAGFLYVLFFK